jgi:hypothetical protein
MVIKGMTVWAVFAATRHSSILSFQVQEINGACLLATPCCESACISARCVSIIFVERAPGQNTTSKPAPDGMMKVEVWSSKANVKRVSQRP